MVPSFPPFQIPRLSTSVSCMDLSAFDSEEEVLQYRTNPVYCWCLCKGLERFRGLNLGGCWERDEWQWVGTAGRELCMHRQAGMPPGGDQAAGARDVHLLLFLTGNWNSSFPWFLVLMVFTTVPFSLIANSNKFNFNILNTSPILKTSKLTFLISPSTFEFSVLNNINTQLFCHLTLEQVR